VDTLDASMDLGYVAFTFPIQFVINLVFCKLTKRQFHLNISYLLDFIIVICMIVWFDRYEYYMSVENDGMSLQSNPTNNQMFL